MLQEISYGIIPLQKHSGEWWVLLVQHKKGFWAFPKGHAEPGETPRETAIRELCEETGLIPELFLSEQTLAETYIFQRNGQPVQKKVLYFLAQVHGELVLQTSEVLEGCWIKLIDAVSKISFPESKVICLRAIQMLELSR